MGHVRLGWVAAAGLLAAVSIGRSANAADQGITGKKLSFAPPDGFPEADRTIDNPAALAVEVLRRLPDLGTL